MTHSCLKYEWALLIFFHGILLLCMSSSLISATVSAFANEADRLALLDFKNRITQDPLQIMSSWNDSIHFCNWLGVTCGPSSKRVMVLNLSTKKLSGSMPPSIGNLTHLTGINLENNSFYGEIPQEVGRLHRLWHLSLTYNSFGGKLPTNMSYCSQLRELTVGHNELVGQIPDHLSSLSKLVYLRLDGNNLTGNIPAWIGNFSSLYALSLSENNFQGSIPNELGYLPGLKYLQLSVNNLSEYGMGGQVSTLGDVYSYGILLLELFIGKRPIDEMFKDGMNIYNFTAMALPEHVMDILDPLMFFGEEDEDVNDDKHKDDIEERAIIEDQHVNVSRKIKDCLISVFRIGLSCSTISQDERVPMNVVVNEMNAIRDTFLKYKMRKQKKKELG